MPFPSYPTATTIDNSGALAALPPSISSNVLAAFLATGVISDPSEILPYLTSIGVHVNTETGEVTASVQAAAIYTLLVAAGAAVMADTAAAPPEPQTETIDPFDVTSAVPVEVWSIDLPEDAGRYLVETDVHTASDGAAQLTLAVWDGNSVKRGQTAPVIAGTQSDLSPSGLFAAGDTVALLAATNVGAAVTVGLAGSITYTWVAP